MITRINNKNIKNAEAIREIFQLSYSIESRLLNAIDFPPLNRSISQFTNCESEFHVYKNNDKIIGVIETKNIQNKIHIQSLVVHPEYFRRGIGSKLVQFTINNNIQQIFTVETGVKNLPAVKLYENFGFIEIDQWDTDHGVRKIKFKKIK